MLFTLLLLGGAALPQATAAAAPNDSTGSVSFGAAFDEVTDLLAKGKTELVKGNYAEALAHFEAAHEKSGGKVATDLWLQRARMSNGALDEAFERIVELESDAENPADWSYAVGVGRYLVGKREEANGGNPGGPFDEARGYLKDAVDADADAYPDAWRMLAEAARWTGDSATASSAIGRALESNKDGATLLLASKIRVAQGSSMLGAEETKDAGKRMVSQGVDDAKAAIKAMGTDKANAVQLCDANLQLGVGQLFLENKDEAAKAYSEAMGWDPTQVDYNQLFGIFVDEDKTSKPFVEALTSGGDKFSERWGKNSASDATLRWWLGFGQRSLGSYDDAIASYQAAVAKYPAFSDSYWYIGMSHYNKGIDHYEEAAKSFRQYATADRASFVSYVKGNETHLKVLKFIEDKLYAGGTGRNRDGRGVEEAADVAELVLLVEDTAQRWNNVGLFHRDAGQVVAQMQDYKPMMTADEHYERSWETYNKALEMARTSYHLNDAAVLLHYYLERDYDHAIEMYDEAEAMATKRLAEEKLSAEEKPLVEIALRDAVNNRKALKKKIEDAKRRAEKKDEKPVDGESGGGDSGGDSGGDGK
jgi:tetratricopeptide (TPR) repeat protein